MCLTQARVYVISVCQLDPVDKTLSESLQILVHLCAVNSREELTFTLAAQLALKET